MSDPETEGGPAFPSENDAQYFHGMTLRDWFAGQAMANIEWAPIDAYLKLCGNRNSNEVRKFIADAAYAQADAMLAAREGRDG